VDVLQSDQLGRLGLTMKGCKKRDEIVFNTIRSLDIPSTLTLGGGYSRDINVIIQAHVNTISTGLEILG
jgi:acetoin utilization deacetylase AcuC-like enzyme